MLARRRSFSKIDLINSRAWAWRGNSSTTAGGFEYRQVRARRSPPFSLTYTAVIQKRRPRCWGGDRHGQTPTAREIGRHIKNLENILYYSVLLCSCCTYSSIISNYYYLQQAGVFCTAVSVLFKFLGSIINTPYTADNAVYLQHTQQQQSQQFTKYSSTAAAAAVVSSFTSKVRRCHNHQAHTCLYKYMYTAAVLRCTDY